MTQDAALRCTQRTQRKIEIDPILVFATQHYRHVSHELRCGEGQIRYQSVSLVLAIVKTCLKGLSEAHTTQTKPGPSHGRPDCRPPTTTRRAVLIGCHLIGVELLQKG